MDDRVFWYRYQKGSRHGAAVARPDRGDARHRRGGAADHRSRRRLQAVHPGPDPVDGAQRDGAGLPPAADRRASRASSRGSGSSTRPARSSGCATWDNPEEYARTVARSYRRDFWNQQPHRVQVWSEKGTVRGVLAPVLDHLRRRLPVRCMASTSATAAHDIAEDDDGRD